MGWFGNLCRAACSCVCATVKTIARTVADGAERVMEGVRNVGHMVSDGWKKFTGQNVAEEADRRWAALDEKSRRRKTEFEKFMAEMTEQVNAEIETINSCREQLNKRAFPRFCDLAANFSNWSVKDIANEKAVVLHRRKCDAVRSRDELMKIDFRNHPVKANLAAVFTLGFATRKLAKESLAAVQEEEKRMEAEFAMLDAEQARHQALLKSLQQVSRIFRAHLEVYDRILDEVDYAVALLKNGRNILSGIGTEGTFDLGFLPERHVLALKAADAATRIAFSMGACRYVSQQDGRLEEVKADMDRNQRDARSSGRVAALLAA